MSIRKVVAGLLITAGIAIMAVSFFWCTTGERNTNQLINEFEQTLEEKLSQQEIPLLVRRLIAVDDQLTGKIDSRAGRRSQCAKVGLHRTGGQYLRRSRLKSLAQYEFQTADLVSAGADARHVVSLDPQGHILARRGGVQWVERSGRRHQLDAGRVL